MPRMKETGSRECVTKGCDSAWGITKGFLEEVILKPQDKLAR